jgi:hypothetical protein
MHGTTIASTLCLCFTLTLTLTLASVSAPNVPLTPYTIDAGFDAPASVFACDLDGDGFTDVLGAAAGADEIAWWKNGGGFPVVWTKQVIASGVTNAHEVYACDLDRDGDTDVLGAVAGTGTIAWWRNDGGNPIVWTQQTLSSSFGGARSVHAADLDGDGDLDVVGAALTGNEFAWWRNDGGSPIAWTKFTIALVAGAHMVRLGDIDGDGDTDIIGAAYTADEILWWRNDGGNPVVWTPFVVATGFDGAVTVCPSDIDADGDLDILGAAQDASDLAWWSNEGGSPIAWQVHSIDTDFAGVWPAYAADLDGDLYTDVVAGGNTADEIRWWKNGLAEAKVGTTNPHRSDAAGLRLLQNSPNPFARATTIRFDLPATSYVELSVYTLTGKLVRILVASEIPAGTHSAGWNGVDSKGQAAASGLYFYRIVADSRSQTRPMILLR